MPAMKDSSAYGSLRQQAEEMLRERPDTEGGPSTGLLELIQELKIHQAELEIQNEELQRAQGELSLLHQAYERLYEFAPCGYLTLSDQKIITNINLTGTKLLGWSKNRYIGPGFQHVHRPAPFPGPFFAGIYPWGAETRNIVLRIFSDRNIVTKSSALVHRGWSSM